MKPIIPALVQRPTIQKNFIMLTHLSCRCLSGIALACASITFTACNGSSFSGGTANKAAPPSSSPAASANAAPSAGLPSTASTPAGTPSTVPANINPSDTIDNGAICNKNVAVALVMDVSGSMGKSANGGGNFNSSGHGPWDDGGGNGQPTKLDIAMQAAQAFVSKFTNPGDMIGLISFSDSASVLAPMSTNKSTVQSAIGQLMVMNGTNITDGLTQGASLLSSVPAGTTKVLILMSDGQNRAPGDPIAAAASIKQSGVVLMTLGYAALDGQDDMRAMATDPSYYFDSTDSTAFTQNFATIATKLCR